jgi:hypothetical protein
VAPEAALTYAPALQAVQLVAPEARGECVPVPHAVHGSAPAGSVL